LITDNKVSDRTFYFREEDIKNLNYEHQINIFKYVSKLRLYRT